MPAFYFMRLIFFINFTRGLKMATIITVALLFNYSIN